MSSSRDRLSGIITPLLPEAWRKVEKFTVKNLGTLSGPRVFIDYTSISHEGMPPGQLVDGFEVALISHLKDYAKAEDALDDAVRAFVRNLDVSNDIAWSTATKRAFGDADYLGWTVIVQLLTPSTEE
ncbi:hypothetical protein SK224_00225 [Microbacterium sp. BG28]|uniref:hypothetical protein n=1 Tax=Microbacterium sp. BG28 TaxID=3097356 RepID=UPI002A5A1261|nr:hypothetical protein [Microbacterium sp. BG28]MDY0827545.1 hypothetical protein [Microbacterium sp. BG28]